MFEIKTIIDAEEVLDEAMNFILNMQDKIKNKVDEKTRSELETAYVEINFVAEFLKELRGGYDQRYRLVKNGKENE